MIVAATTSILLLTSLLFVIAQIIASEHKTIYHFGFAIHHKNLPAKVIYKVNYVHNQDTVPRGTKKPAYIKNYVI